MEYIKIIIPTPDWRELERDIAHINRVTNVKSFTNFLRRKRMLVTGSINPNEFLTIVCEYYQASKEDVLSSSKKREIVKAKQWLSWLLHRNGLSFSYIAHHILHQNHANPRYSYYVIEDLLDVEDPETIKDYNFFKNFVVK